MLIHKRYRNNTLMNASMEYKYFIKHNLIRIVAYEERINR